MFFGSRRATKATAAAEVAALGAWRVPDGKDRVGAIVFGDSNNKNSMVMKRINNNPLNYLVLEDDGSPIEDERRMAEIRHAIHEGLSNIEQVTGRRHRVQFQIQMDTASVAPFLADARAAFGGTDIHYWVVPVFSAGRLGASQPAADR